MATTNSTALGASNSSGWGPVFPRPVTEQGAWFVRSKAFSVTRPRRSGAPLARHVSIRKMRLRAPALWSRVWHLNHELRDLHLRPFPRQGRTAAGCRRDYSRSLGANPARTRLPLHSRLQRNSRSATRVYPFALEG